MALGGRVFCGSRDGRLYAFDPDTGEIVGRVPLGGYVHTTPATDGLRLYVGSWRGLFAFTTNDEDLIEAHPEMAFPLSRARAAALVLRAFEGLLPTQPAGGRRGPFADVAPSDPYFEAIVGAARQVIIEGYPSGMFRPNRAIIWNEFVMVCWRASGAAGIRLPRQPVDFVESNHWSANAWAWMAGAGVLPEGPDPRGPVTVAEAKAMIEALVARAEQP